MKSLSIASLICCVLLAWGFTTEGLSQQKLQVLMERHYYPEYEEMFEEILNEWAAKRGVKFELSAHPSDLVVQKINTAIASGIGPDLCLTLVYHIPIIKDSIVDVSDVAEEAQRKAGPYFAFWKEMAVFDGKWLTVPIADVPPTWCYRKDWHKEAGLEAPETWHDALINAMKLNDPPRRFGLGFPFSRSYDLMGWWRGLWWGYGGRLVEKDGKTVVVDSPETRVAMDWAADLYRKWAVCPPGVIGWGGGDNNTAFLTGKVAAITNAASVFFVAEKDDLPIAKQIGHALIPRGPKGRFVAFMWGRSWVIPKYTKNVELAKDFLRYYSTKDVQIRINTAARGFYTPAHIGIMEEIPLFKDPMYAVLVEVTKDNRSPGYPGPLTVPAVEVIHKWVFADVLNELAREKLTVEQAVKEASERVKDIYAEYFPK